jgi:hypothetical protein
VSASRLGDEVVDGTYQALGDPISDRLFTLLMSVLAEVWTTRDRVRLLEAELSRHGVVVPPPAADDEELAALRVDREAFVARVFRGIMPAGRTD